MRNRNLLLLILLVVPCAMCCISASAGQITHTVSFDPSKLTIRYDTIDSVAYAKVYYSDMASVNAQGSPVLPSDILLFSVPYNADDFDVHYNVVSYNEYQLNADVYPGPYVMELNDSSVIVYNQKAPEIYGANSFYPDSLFKVLSSGFMFGGNKVLKTHIYPLYYNPTTKTLRLVTSMQLVINYDSNSLAVPSVVRRNNYFKEKEQSLTELYVQNGEDVSMNAFVPTAPLENHLNRTDELIPTYNYCIITSRELEPAFKKIIAMKRQRGLSAGTVCVEDLMASPMFNKGDYNFNSISNETHILDDSAGVVRNYLKYAFDFPTEPTSFVLMGGKKGHVPVRYFNVHDGVATDNYYSDLTQLWDEMGNILIWYGNQVDRPISFNPDLFVGRLLCDNQSEIDNYSDKLRQYVFDPGDGDGSYLKRSLYFCTYEYDDDFDVGPSNSSDFFDSTNTMRPYSSSYTGADLIDEINATGYGYVSAYCAGEPQAIYIGGPHLITALDEYVVSEAGYANEDGNGLDNLTNKKFPAIFHSLSSSAITFDNSADLNHLTQYANKYNLGESLTVGKKYGGIAFLGNTKFGYREWSFPLELNFFKSMRWYQIYNLGVSEAMSKVLNGPYHEYWFEGHYNDVTTSHNLIGDPEVEMWTSEPQRYDGIIISRLENGFRIIGVSSLDNIAYCDNCGRQGLITGVENNPVFVPAHPTSTLMIYNHDHVPYIVPMMLQNCEINNSQYVYASSFSAGSNILQNITQGNVTIKTGAIYEIEATDDVRLGEGFYVENGATFAIKTPGKVTIDGCVFQSGANVKIEAGKVEILKSFTAEQGAKVEMTQYVE